MVELTRDEALEVIKRIENETTVHAKLIGEEGNWMVMIHDKSFLLQKLYQGWHSVEEYVKPAGSSMPPASSSKPKQKSLF